MKSLVELNDERVSLGVCLRRGVDGNLAALYWVARLGQRATAWLVPPEGRHPQYMFPLTFSDETRNHKQRKYQSLL